MSTVMAVPLIAVIVRSKEREPVPGFHCSVSMYVMSMWMSVIHDCTEGRLTITLLPTPNPDVLDTLNVFVPPGMYESVMLAVDPVFDAPPEPDTDTSVRAAPVAWIIVPSPAPRSTTPLVPHEIVPLHGYVPAFK